MPELGMPKEARSGSLDTRLNFPRYFSKHRSYFGSLATETSGTIFGPREAHEGDCPADDVLQDSYCRSFWNSQQNNVGSDVLDA
jgi:hypothetical protein